MLQLLNAISFLYFQLVTFQLTIATDGKSTYAIYIYDDEGMLWNQNWLQPHVGYGISNGQDVQIKKLNTAGESKAYRYDAVYGNTGRQGRWIYKLAEGIDNNAAKCVEWYEKQPSRNLINAMRSFRRSDCPCVIGQVMLDRRFRLSEFKADMICYKQRMTWIWSSTVSAHTSCCYRLSDSSLVTEIEPDLGPTTQMFVTQKYNWITLLFFPSIRRQSRRIAVQDDTEAFGFCCQKSSSQYCDLYQEKRPIPTCSRYRPPPSSK